MLAEKNYIKKLVVEVETTSMEQAVSIKEDISTFLKTVFYAELDKILSEISKNNNHNTNIKLSKIEATFYIKKGSDLNHMKDAIATQIREQITAQIQKKNEGSEYETGQLKNNSKSDFIIYFLKTGMYPWWYKNDEKNFEDELKNWIFGAAPLTKLRKICNQSICLNRLILSTENKLIIDLILIFLDEPKKTILANFSDFPALESRSVRLGYFSALFGYSGHKDIEKFKRDFVEIPFVLHSDKTQNDVQKLVDFTTEIIINSTSVSEENIAKFKAALLSKLSAKRTNKKVEISTEQKVTSENISEEVSATKNNETEFYISNAGLIILHPFLHSFFEKLHIIEDGTIVKKDEAVHLLHYLATKTEQPYEHQLTFEKYLCAVPQNYPINRFVKLTDVQKEECESLLGAVLEHWSALRTKNTDVLRSEFLVREGKLTLEKELEKVFIQRKAQDLLLDKIPWTIGLAKLPWKKELIYTEW